jgi:hypothetical protein
MIAFLASALIAAFPADVTYRDGSLEVDGALLDARFVDIDGGARRQLVLVVRPRNAEQRELRLYPLDERGMPARKPARVVPILEDVTAYGFADVRPEPGRELLFFTRGGVWALSTKIDGLRDNIERLVQHDLVFDVPDRDSLAFWEYVLDNGKGAGTEKTGRRDLVVVPGLYSFSLWGAGEESSGYRELVGFGDIVNAGSLDDATRVVVKQEANLNVAGSTVSVDRNDTDESRVMIDDGGRMKQSLLSFGRSYAAPALADLDGDGRTDLIVPRGHSFRIHIATASGIPQEPTRIEPIPDYLGESPPGELVDVDGDGDADLVSLKSEKGEGGGFVSDVYTLLVMLNDGRRLLPEQPDQLMRFEAMEMRVEIADVDGDGLKDLIVRKFEVPSVVDVVTSLDFTHTTLLYRGTGGGKDGRVFDRRPVLKKEKVYDEQSVQGAIASRNLTWDFSGDGIADLVEIDAHGVVSIRRLEYTSSFFRGDRWTLDSDPWKRLDGKGSIASLVVDDVNGDGLGDVLSRRKDGVLILISERGGRR